MSKKCYNFSIAVWVGYIALFGTAIQTGVVMVVYLQEAVARKRAEPGESTSHDDLIQAVKDGARLRLRPKVMTVATIVGGLLPIMWSNRAGGGSNEATCHTDHRWHGEQSYLYFNRDAGGFLLVA